MEEKLLKKTAVFLAAVAAVVCVIVFYLPQFADTTQQMITSFREYRLKTRAERLNMTGLELLAYNNEQEEKENGKADFSSQLRLELPLGVSGDALKVTEQYVDRTISIRIPYAGQDYVYQYPMLGKSDHIERLDYQNGDGYGSVEFQMDSVYEVSTRYDEDYFYVDFLTPQEVYDKVVVIDAGHGGEESGTAKQGILEKEIDLDIVLELKKIFDEAGDPSVGVYYTRTDDSNPDPEKRVELANMTHADVFISVHNNSTQSGRMSSINGTQVLYDETKAEQQPGTMGLAQICLEEVTASTGSSNKGLVAGSEDTLIHSSEVPVALIEAGFMTNQTELENLCTEEYQVKVAQGIYQAVRRALAEGY